MPHIEIMKFCQNHWSQVKKLDGTTRFYEHLSRQTAESTAGLSRKTFLKNQKLRDKNRAKDKIVKYTL
jgi:hypothetical protein